MGFFDWLRDKGKELKEKAVEKAVEKVEKALDKVEKAITALENLLGLGNSDSYSGSVRETVDIDKVLKDFQEALAPQAEELERTCIGQVLAQFDQYIEEKEAEYPELVDALKKKRNEVQKNLANTIMDHVSKRASTNDEELKSILEMERGNEKTRKLEEQSDKILKEAVDRFKKRLKEEIDGLNKDLSERFNKALKEQEDELQKKKEAYEQLSDEIANGKQNLDDLEEDVLLVSNACFCMEYLFAQMEKEEK